MKGCEKRMWLLIMIILLMNFTVSYENDNDNDDSENSFDKKPPCPAKNCLSCNKKNECSQCRGKYVLFNKRCYSNECEVYGDCLYCTEFDCVQCRPGFKVSYGFCEESSFFTVKVLTILIVICIVLLLLFIGLCIYFFKEKLNKKRNDFLTAEYLNSKTLCGQYIIINPQNNNFVFNQTITSNNPSVFNTNKLFDNETNHQPLKPFKNNNDSCKETPQEKLSMSGSILPLENNRHIHIKTSNRKPFIHGGKRCLVCNSHKINSFANCGCGLCYKDYSKIIKKKKKFLCPTHKTIIREGYIFMKDKKQFQLLSNETKETNDNSIKESSIKMCPVCQISPGTCTFNCGCPVLLCAKCFNDNMNMFNIRQCPGCKRKYQEDSKNQ